MAGSRRVLIVEDEALIRMLAVDMLEDFGHSSDEAANAAEALEKLRLPGADYSIVFLDIGLPDMRGDDLVREIRAFDPKLPIVIASGEDKTDLKMRLGTFEPIVFLGKPYDTDKLKEALDALTDDRT